MGIPGLPSQDRSPGGGLGGIFYTTPVFVRGMRDNKPVKTLLRALLCLTLAGLGLAGSARAAVVDGLYEAQVPVADQSSTQLAAALQQAFAAVLVKVSGSRAAGGALASAL